MSKGKRNRARRRQTVGALEHGLAELSKLQIHHERRVASLKTKIAAQEGLIEEAKLDEKEAAAKAAQEEVAD